jgi:hypothetical protein
VLTSYIPRKGKEEGCEEPLRGEWRTDRFSRTLNSAKDEVGYFTETYKWLGFETEAYTPGFGRACERLLVSMAIHRSLGRDEVFSVRHC